mgnify:CR=1 FL=1
MRERRGSAGPSVRARILTTILVVTALGMAIAGLATYQVQRASLLAQIDDELADRFDAAEHLADTAEPRPATAEDLLRRVVSSVTPPADGGAIGLLDGVAALVPGVATTLDLAAHPELLKTAAARSRPGIDSWAHGDVRLRYVAVPMAVGDDPARAVFVVAIDVGRRLAGTNGAALTYAGVSAAVLLVVGAFGWFVAGRLLRPLRALRETAEAISVTDLSRRIPVEGHDDVSALTRTVNDMLGRLDASLASQRALLADVRHELRAPLTVLRGNLELLDPTDAGEADTVRRLGMEEVDRMARLVDELARLTELGIPSTERAELDLATLARDVLVRARGLAGHEWTLARADAVTVVADRDRLLEAWLQLAENAATHSPVGRPIEFAATALDSGAVELTVRDHGPGVPAEERERIFRRGERGAAGAETPGSGLGLAIVAAIARAHGGSATVREAPGGGAVFAIALPRALRSDQGTGAA